MTSDTRVRLRRARGDRAEAPEHLKELARAGTITLLRASRDVDRQAAVLAGRLPVGTRQ